MCERHHCEGDFDTPLPSGNQVRSPADVESFDRPGDSIALRNRNRFSNTRC